MKLSSRASSSLISLAALATVEVMRPGMVISSSDSNTRSAASTGAGSLKRIVIRLLPSRTVGKCETGNAGVEFAEPATGRCTAAARYCVRCTCHRAWR